MAGYTIDNEETRQFCLNCPYPTCSGICPRFVERFCNEAARKQQYKKAALYVYKGESKTVYQWAKAFKMSPSTLYGRLARGLTIAQALETKLDHKEGLTLDDCEKTESALGMVRYDYEYFGKSCQLNDPSVGFVASYGSFKVSPTHKITNVVERVALAEASLSDDDLRRLEWVRLALKVQAEYNAKAIGKTDDTALMGLIMHLKVFERYTTAMVSDTLLKSGMEVSMVKIDRLYGRVIRRVAKEARSKGLLDERLT